MSREESGAGIGYSGIGYSGIGVPAIAHMDQSHSRKRGFQARRTEAPDARRTLVSRVRENDARGFLRYNAAGHRKLLHSLD